MMSEKCVHISESTLTIQNFTKYVHDRDRVDEK